MNLSPSDRTLIARTVMGEANGQPYLGKVGVAAVVRNRMLDGNYGGSDARSVVMKPKQFEPWSTRHAELMGYDETSPGWHEAHQAVDEAFGGNDPTKGATHFLNEGTVAARGDAAGKPGGWASKLANRTKIGDHTFGNADAGRDDGTTRVVDTGDAPKARRARSTVAALGLEDDENDVAGGGFNLAKAMLALQAPPTNEKQAAVRELIHETIGSLLDDIAPANDQDPQQEAA